MAENCKVIKREVLYVQVQVTSPLSVSSGDNEWTDSDVLRDADKDAVRHGAVPHRGIGKRAEAELVEIGLHIEQQAAAGDKVHPKNVVRERCDG